MRAAGRQRFLLPLRHGSPALRRALLERRLERAIGVIYRPETERASHYFHARLADQFDEYAWFGETRAVEELEGPHLQGSPDLYPFAV